MSVISNTYGNNVLNYMFGQTEITIPTGLYMAVSTGAFSETPPHTNEPAPGSGYARVVIPNTTDYWYTSTAKSTHNVQTIQFNTATDDWGTMKYYALMDTGTYGSGYPYVTGALLPNRAVYNGDVLKWTSGNFVINVQ